VGLEELCVRGLHGGLEGGGGGGVGNAEAEQAWREGWGGQVVESAM
jgi:hypothetical protein